MNELDDESDTPRTDDAAFVACNYKRGLVDVVDLDFSEQLERELNEAKAEIERLKNKRCKFCRELPQTENEKAYLAEFGDKKGDLPTMEEWLLTKQILSL